MFKWFAKKYAVKIVNDIISKLNEKVDVESYRQKIIKIMTFLSNLLQYLDDKQIDEEEADKIIEETKNLF